MAEEMTDEAGRRTEGQQACAHLRVLYMTEQIEGGLTRGLWECDLYRAKFVPATSAEYAVAQAERVDRGRVATQEEALRWAADHGEEHLKPWVAWSECGDSQRQGFHWWGCDGEFISTWRAGWPQPTETTFPHGAGCKYLQYRAALTPTALAPAEEG